MAYDFFVSHVDFCSLIAAGVEVSRVRIMFCKNLDQVLQETCS